MVQEVWWCRRCGVAGGVMVQEVWWCRRCGGAGGVVVQEVWWCRRCDGMSLIPNRVKRYIHPGSPKNTHTGQR